VRIRRARSEDVSAIARIAAESYRHAFAAILEPRALQARGTVFFRRRLRRMRTRLRVATLRGRVVGFSLTTRRHLDMLFVAPRLTGRGAGLRLLRDVERRGVRTLECFRDNVHAIRQSAVLAVELGEEDPVPDSLTDDIVWLVANRRFADFRAILAHAPARVDRFPLLPYAAAQLGVGDGDTVRAVPLAPRDR